MANEENKIKEEGKLIGKVSHYFSNIGVAVVDLSSPISVGDTIRISGGETDFTQVVVSIEMDRKKVQKAKKGDSIGIKIAQKAREDYKVYKL